MKTVAAVLVALAASCVSGADSLVSKQDTWTSLRAHVELPREMSRLQVALDNAASLLQREVQVRFQCFVANNSWSFSYCT